MESPVLPVAVCCSHVVTALLSPARSAPGKRIMGLKLFFCLNWRKSWQTAVWLALSSPKCSPCVTYYNSANAEEGCCWRMWFRNSGNEHSGHRKWWRTLLTSITSNKSQLVSQSQPVLFFPGEKENAQVVYVFSQFLHGWPRRLVVKYHGYERGCVWQPCHTDQLFSRVRWPKSARGRRGSCRHSSRSLVAAAASAPECTARCRMKCPLVRCFLVIGTIWSHSCTSGRKTLDVLPRWVSV